MMQKSTITRTLKIVVDNDLLSSEEISNIERWENEGGSAVASLPVSSSSIPFRQGEIFEIKDVEIRYENDRVYCFLDIVLLSI